MRKINRHIIHCSASRDTLDIGAKAIDMWHRERGWSEIGYHYVIRRDGTIENGRSLEKKGAHCKGHNTGSIGTCLVGIEEFSIMQYESLEKIHKQLITLFPGIELNGHRDFTNKKTCPNFDVHDWWGKVELRNIFEKTKAKEKSKVS